jgi:hypothetical protein
VKQHASQLQIPVLSARLIVWPSSRLICGATDASRYASSVTNFTLGRPSTPWRSINSLL